MTWIRPVYSQAVAFALQLIYGVVSGRVLFDVVGADIGFESTTSRVVEARLSPELAYSNMAFLVTLLLVTPGMNLRKRLSSLLVGTGLLFATHLGYFIAKVELTFNQAKHTLGSHPALWEFLDFFFELMGKGLFPVSIWLLLTLPYMLGRVDSSVPESKVWAVGRNVPCPCGSGKKYKRCCGAS